VTEAEVKANADYMAARLAKLGWRYVVATSSGRNRSGSARIIR